MSQSLEKIGIVYLLEISLEMKHRLWTGFGIILSLVPLQLSLDRERVIKTV